MRQANATFTTSEKDRLSANLLSELAAITAQIREASTVWYVVSDYCPDDGKTYLLPKRNIFPDCWVMHPNTLERFLSEVPSFMVARPLNSYKPQYTFEIPQLITDLEGD